MQFIPNTKITGAAPPSRKLVMQIMAPATGKVTPLSQVNFPTFQAGLLGDGIAITLTTGQIFAPVTGRLDSIDMSKGQVCWVSKNGLKLLMQIGEPYKINHSERITYHVKPQHQVKSGECIVTCDPLWMKQQGIEPLLIMTLLNTAKLHCIELVHSDTLRAPEDVLFRLYT